MKITRAGISLLLVGGFFLLTAMGASSPSGSDGRPASPTEINKLEKNRAPDFSLKDVGGHSTTLSALKGKVVLLSFWATWCPPCLSEMPAFNKLYREMRPRGLEIVAVSADSSIGYLKDYLKKNSFDFRILYDEGRVVIKQYKVFSMPTTFLIDKSGVIVEKFFGEYDWNDQEIKKKIEKLL